MTISDFYSLEKDDKFYLITTSPDRIYEFIVIERKNNIITYCESNNVNIKITFTICESNLGNLLYPNCVLYKDLVQFLNKLSKDDLIKILKNPLNKKTIKPIQYDFVEYLI